MDATGSLIVGLVLGLVLGGGVGALLMFARGGRQFAGDERRRADEQRSHAAVLQALAPVSSSLAELRQTVAALEQQRAQQHGELSQQLRAAGESGEALRRTTESLAGALNSNSTRGVWGEAQLRRVVEAAGLVERVDFDVQASIESDAGLGRPDMVVHLPGGKAIAVDAKAPMTKFLAAQAIPETATGPESARRRELLAEHVKDLRGHITALGGKAYWQGLDASPEFVVAFLPSESLVSAAMRTDAGLMEFAFAKRVALASPVTLWAVLKSVAVSWQHEVVTNDAKRLFDLSRELYGRLATMSGHIDKLGRSLTAGVNDYNRFVGSLERSVLVSARKLATMDESTLIPDLAGVEPTPRKLTAAELQGDRLASGEMSNSAELHGSGLAGGELDGGELSGAAMSRNSEDAVRSSNGSRRG